MKNSFIVNLCLLLSACSNPNWTSSFLKYGFKDGYESTVVYRVGGSTKLVVNVSSEMFKEFKYPLILTILINDRVCVTKTVTNSETELLIRATCEVDLGAGKHIFQANIISTDKFKNISVQKDRESNSFHGSLTYVLED